MEKERERETLKGFLALLPTQQIHQQLLHLRQSSGLDERRLRHNVSSQGLDIGVRGKVLNIDTEERVEATVANFFFCNFELTFSYTS